MTQDNDLPEWAAERCYSNYVRGAQLCTRDGRRCGNAHIIDIRTYPYPDSPEDAPKEHTYYLLLTDAGNRMELTREELDSLFFPPEYRVHVERVLADFDRPSLQPGHAQQERLALMRLLIEQLTEPQLDHLIERIRALPPGSLAELGHASAVCEPVFRSFIERLAPVLVPALRTPKF